MLLVKFWFHNCYITPVIKYDPAGNVAWWVIGAAIGAVVGAAVGGAISYAKDGKVDWRYVAAGAVAGALVGAGVGHLAQAAYTSATATAAAAKTVGTGTSIIGAASADGDPTNEINSVIQTGYKTYYHVTSFGSAQSISQSSRLYSGAFDKVGVLQFQPTLQQAKLLGCQSYETVTKFTSNHSFFEWDKSTGLGNLPGVLIDYGTQAYIYVNNIIEVGFRK